MISFVLPYRQSGANMTLGNEVPAGKTTPLIKMLIGNHCFAEGFKEGYLPVSLRFPFTEYESGEWDVTYTK